MAAGGATRPAFSAVLLALGVQRLRTNKKIWSFLAKVSPICCRWTLWGCNGSRMGVTGRIKVDELVCSGLMFMG